MARVVALGSDHAGLALKNLIKAHLQTNYEVIDVGTQSLDRCDYPNYAVDVSKLVVEGQAFRGVLVCGTGIGMSIAANKVKGIRAAMCHSEYDAEMTRAHNDANICTIGARTTGEGLAISIVDRFLTSNFETDAPNHVHRVALIAEIERNSERQEQ